MKLEQLAGKLNFQQKGSTFVRTFSGYDVSLIMYKIPGSYAKIPMMIFVLNKPIDKADTKIILKATKLRGIIKESIALKDNAILVNPRFKDIEKFEAYVNKMVTVLQELRLKQLDYCPYCGEVDTDSIRVIKGATVNVHDKCVKDFVEKVSTHLETVGSSKDKILISIIFALIGGFIGLLPSIIVLFAVGFYSAWLFLLIPYAAFYGFKQGGAQKGAYVMVVIAVISFIYAPGFMAFAYYSMAALEGFTFAEALAIDEFRIDFLTDMFMSVLFTALAVFFSWKKIYGQTHGQIKRDINELKG